MNNTKKSYHTKILGFVERSYEYESIQKLEIILSLKSNFLHGLMHTFFEQCQKSPKNLQKERYALFFMI